MKIILTSFCLFFLFGCQDTKFVETEIENRISSVELIRTEISRMISGEIKSQTTENVGSTFYRFTVEPKLGGIVLFDYSLSGALIQISSSTPPYNYEIIPAAEIITFSEARTIAQDRISGDIKFWRLRLNKSEEWEYRFHIEAGDRVWDLKIHAVTGIIKSIT
jgi:uncharacterized membrane protein YkoI